MNDLQREISEWTRFNSKKEGWKPMTDWGLSTDRDFIWLDNC